MQKPELFGPKFKADPYPTYAQLRDQAPVCPREYADGTTLWFVTGYEEVAAMLRDHQRIVKDLRNTMTPEEVAALPEEPEQYRLLANHMVNLDPPDHTRLRALVNKAFTNLRVESLRPEIQAIADTLIDQVIDRGHMDILDEYALPLPIAVITKLLGIPSADGKRFHDWSHAFITSSANRQRSRKKLARAGRMMADFTDYMRAIFAERRQQPQDDLITSLLQAEESGDTLSEEELFSMVILLVVSGHETVANTMANGILALLSHPEELEKLKSDPSLIDSAVEEILRYDGSMERATMRFAAQDIPIGNQTICRGDSVSLVLSAANRDPAAYKDAETFDIARFRNDPETKRHMGLGMGIHYCLGAKLGRMEVAIAINTLLRRLPNLTLAIDPSELRWRAIPVVRSMEHLPVKF